MKTILLILLVFITTACLKENPVKVSRTDTAFYINKVDSTFEIYSNKRELILEFTPQNTDSASLETLEDIYQTVKEFYNREKFEEAPPKTEGTKNI